MRYEYDETALGLGLDIAGYAEFASTLQDFGRALFLESGAAVEQDAMGEIGVRDGQDEAAFSRPRDVR